MTLSPQDHAARQAWLTRVRDKLNRLRYMVGACDLAKRTCGEVVAAEQFADKYFGNTDDTGLGESLPEPPSWLLPFEPAKGESLRDTRRRARAELARETEMDALAECDMGFAIDTGEP